MQEPRKRAGRWEATIKANEATIKSLELLTFKRAEDQITSMLSQHERDLGRKQQQLDEVTEALDRSGGDNAALREQIESLRSRSEEEVYALKRFQEEYLAKYDQRIEIQHQIDDVESQLRSLRSISDGALVVQTRKRLEQSRQKLRVLDAELQRQRPDPALSNPSSSAIIGREKPPS